MDVQLRGCEADATVQLWLRSDPVIIGDVTIGADGSATATVAIPATTAV